MLLNEVKAGMTLARDIVDDRGNLLLEEGIALTEFYITRLKQMGLNSIPIYDPYAAELKKNTVIATEIRENLITCFRSLFNKKSPEILNSGLNSDYVTEIQQSVRTVIDETEKKLPQIINIQVRQPTEDEIGHAVNVCLMAIATGLYIKLPRPVLMDLALGALFHDLGKAVVPAINGPASDPERLHPIYGQQLLLKNKVGSIAARIAAEHHERYDGQGYPSGLVGKEIHPLSRLVAIVNHFDNEMTAASKTGAPRHTLAEDMLAGGNTQFDLYLLRAFFHTAPLYPVGSLVRLTTNQLAYVVKNKVRFAATPIVEVAEQNTRTNGLTATGQLIDLAMKPNIAITDVIAE
ncbi:HD-GYP domain-containing protein [Sporomusa malonica]|uniref:HD-GYP domain, c-di-GMP phosphodiesterase class II (Or its inactivated variant) n=1 Tax=Sporomusa malonica TaxID=112901 RepID=A0A1W2EL96_9FIRM|nr:HD domain-containing phosphohydrolase [Sporomusa malonica]SMD10477.1 HD-GYP domain, c-di-GMP phosphodiesterase class II (or its inactivated variant) [Sporomusa malonica]